MPWIEVIAVFIVSHVAGDFMLQTEWQATRKRHGSAPVPEQLRALTMHVLTYMVAFVPALVWLGTELSAAAVAVVAVAIASTHWAQDDGRALRAYIRTVKKSDPRPGDPLFTMIDQSLHLIVLFAIALAAGT